MTKRDMCFVSNIIFQCDYVKMFYVIQLYAELNLTFNTPSTVHAVPAAAITHPVNFNAFKVVTGCRCHMLKHH